MQEPRRAHKSHHSRPFSFKLPRLPLPSSKHAINTHSLSSSSSTSTDPKYVQVLRCPIGASRVLVTMILSPSPLDPRWLIDSCSQSIAQPSYRHNVNANPPCDCNYKRHARELRILPCGEAFIKASHWLVSIALWCDLWRIGRRESLRIDLIKL